MNLGTLFLEVGCGAQCGTQNMYPRLFSFAAYVLVASRWTI